ncbi:1,2-phenylacetyl-CoA epoxidase subunit PaaD [Glutamicibacter sp. NPDC055491]|uniref:1,2-phenylacetyl-CoA epoxidase subunit PaaD n=1 Tax=Micrococcaceae TaxID=1268 RepID=UPI000CFDD24C|nr:MULTISPECIES: 1,2-phenylacetyl-CoA epoxidase subunit PaaD [unclassified Arthrobacter]PQZ88873.1 phenylacetate-CoA oxygenase subunit PaaJ [Arthrobacter sp. MYb222]PRB74256.1 phenylacetate-CoA oxygenase subunit PaaJ [Arthrobacter sp. MYb214]TDU27696.1 ring-1,2-phenylacetyl-CoA epoxidase subunit PaaD [Arthrobacter sp. JUb115]
MSKTIAGAKDLFAIASQVTDPEIPVLSIADLGILREVEMAEDGTVQVVITPTYSGCPAMDAINGDLYTAFADAGYEKVDVKLVLSPAWSTDWMTAEGKAKLEEYGIAPPTGQGHAGRVTLGMSVKCPRCHSLNTRELARFASTSCKALYTCKDCLEPFDYFKVLS